MKLGKPVSNITSFHYGNIDWDLYFLTEEMGEFFIGGGIVYRISCDICDIVNLLRI